MLSAFGSIGFTGSLASREEATSVRGTWGAEAILVISVSCLLKHSVSRSGMALQTSSTRVGGSLAKSQARPTAATVATLISYSAPQRECTPSSKIPPEHTSLADSELEMGAAESSPQDFIDLSCLPDDFVDALRSVAEVKRHQKNGRYTGAEADGAYSDTYETDFQER